MSHWRLTSMYVFCNLVDKCKKKSGVLATLHARIVIAYTDRCHVQTNPGICEFLHKPRINAFPCVSAKSTKIYVFQSFSPRARRARFWTLSWKIYAYGKSANAHDNAPTKTKTTTRRRRSTTNEKFAFGNQFAGWIQYLETGTTLSLEGRRTIVYSSRIKFSSCNKTTNQQLCLFKFEILLFQNFLASTGIRILFSARISRQIGEDTAYLASTCADCCIAQRTKARDAVTRRAIIYHQTDHAWNNIQRASLAGAVSGNNSCPGICIIYSRRREIPSTQTFTFRIRSRRTCARPFRSLRDPFERFHRCKSLSASAKFRSSS